MFNNILTFTKAAFQQLEFNRPTSPTAYDPFQSEQVSEELNCDVYASTDVDLSLCDEEDDITLVNKIVDDVDDDTYIVNSSPNSKKSVVNHAHLMASITAKNVAKKVITGTVFAYRSASTEKKRLQNFVQKKSEKLVYVPKRTPVMRGYGVDFGPIFERPFDLHFCVDLSNKNSRRSVNVDSGVKYIDIPMKAFSNENDWGMVHHDYSVQFKV